MAKIYKLEAYIIDANDEYEDEEQLESHLDYLLDRGDISLQEININSSEEFEWEDDLRINKTAATKDDYEKYFKEDE